MFDVKNKNAFLMLIIGKRNKGKSSLLIKMLLHKKLLRDKFDNVYLINPTFEEDQKYHCVEFTDVITEYNTETIQEIKNKCIDELNECRKKNEPEKQTLIIFDDCIAHGSKSNNLDDILNELAFNSRHFNISVVILSQYYKGVSRAVRTQSDYVICFQNKNKNEQECLYYEFGTGTKKDFLNFLDVVYNDKFDFIMIDNKNDRILKNFNPIII